MGAMQRYFQTISRIFFGLSSLSVLLLHLWPAKEYVFSDRIESFLYFLVSLGVWIGTEFKESEEVIFRRSTENDIRNARRIIWLARNPFSELFAGTNYHGLKPEYAIRELSNFIDDWNLGVVFFQDANLNTAFEKFANKLETFDKNLLEWGGFDQYGSIYAFGIAPPHCHDRYEGPPEPWKSRIIEADKQSAELNAEMKNFIALIKNRVPEAFDTEITKPA